MCGAAGTEFPCCAGHNRRSLPPLQRSVLGMEIHPDSVGLVDLAADLRDRGKQPAQILTVLLALYAEEPPAEVKTS